MLELSVRNNIIVCPDCGQRFDPAKAAGIARVWTRDGRSIKPSRVDAQDVREAGHRVGRHHQSHSAATRAALGGWAIVSRAVGEFAKECGFLQDFSYFSSEIFRQTVWCVATDQLEGLIVEMDSVFMRESAERSRRAALAVRADHPWWRAYLHELGVGPEEIARGLTVRANSRADLLFERRPRAVPAVGPTLRGVL